MSRYIDADELKRIKFHPLPYPHSIPTDCEPESYKLGWNDAIDAIVDNEPTADVRENVRGEWIRRKDTIQCSQCKAKWIDHTYLIETFRFCPNCGADMRPISALSENVEIVSNLKRGES